MKKINTVEQAKIEKLIDEGDIDHIEGEALSPQDYRVIFHGKSEIYVYTMALIDFLCFKSRLDKIKKINKQQLELKLEKIRKESLDLTKYEEPEEMEIEDEDCVPEAIINFKKQKLVKYHLLDDDCRFIFENEFNILIAAHHKQDCCEDVYAYFSDLDLHFALLKNNEYNQLKIKPIKDEGFLMIFGLIFDEDECEAPFFTKIFIPCYNDQNGYYSANLKLIIKVNSATEQIVNLDQASEFRDG